jgi:hypothetical protein
MFITLEAAFSETWYVSQTSPQDGPGTNEATAFHIIQDAIDAATSNDTIRVDDGVYNTGGAEVYSMDNRVALTKAVSVQSVNGPKATFIEGAGPLGASAVRCAYVTNGAELVGFTLTNGYTRTSGDNQKEQSGGGVWLDQGGTVSNCVMNGNSAYYIGGGAYCGSGGTLNHCTLSANSAHHGGGVYCYGGTLNHCTLSDNSANANGGGAYCALGSTLNDCVLSNNIAAGSAGGAFCYKGGTLNNCTLSDNSANSGGGAYCYSGGTLNNCIVWGNSAPSGANWHNDGTGMTYAYCCTSPDPGGSGNINSNPLFIDASAGNYRLGYGSPCIDSGEDTGHLEDLDGNPRPIDGDFNGTNSFDVGAYEYTPSLYDTDSDGLVDGDEINVHHTNPTLTDSDGDGMLDGVEVSLGYDPALDSSGAIAHGQSTILTDPAAYGLYTSNSITDLDIGYLMLQISNGWMNLWIQLEQCTNLVEGVWTNAGDAVLWKIEAADGKAFYRVRGE